MTRSRFFLRVLGRSFVVLGACWAFSSANAKTPKVAAKTTAKVSAKVPAALTALQILAKLDQNNVFETRRTMATMRIHKRGRTRIKTMKIYSKGEDASYSEFLSPSRDKGVKYLKRKDNLWMYLPSAEKVIKISGHMLRQSMMGSDFSYEDMLDASALRQRYHVTLGKSAKVGQHDCYVLVLKQKKPGETYPKRKIWISKKFFVGLRSELYAASGRLLKVSLASQIKKYGKRYYPTKVRMEDKLKKGTWTEFEMTKIVFKVKLPGRVFSLRNLQSE